MDEQQQHQEVLVDDAASDGMCSEQTQATQAAFFPAVIEDTRIRAGSALTAGMNETKINFEDSDIKIVSP